MKNNSELGFGNIEKILAYQHVPTAEKLKVLRKSFDEPEKVFGILEAFNYGMICGKREERSKRKAVMLRQQIEAAGYELLEEKDMRRLSDSNVIALILDFKDGTPLKFLYADYLTPEQRIKTFSQFLGDIKSGLIDEVQKDPLHIHRGVKVIGFYHVKGKQDKE